jgi:mycoredoxin
VTPFRVEAILLRRACARRPDMAAAGEGTVGHSIELFGAPGCPYTSALREHLRWNHVEFIEYDVEADGVARARLLELTGGGGAVPVLVEDDYVTEIGWHGRSRAVAR